MKAEELLKKIKKLEDISVMSYFPTVTKTKTESSVYYEDWSKGCDRYKIELINQFEKEVCTEQRNICAEIFIKTKLSDLCGRLFLNAPEPD